MPSSFPKCYIDGFLTHLDSLAVPADSVPDVALRYIVSDSGKRPVDVVNDVLNLTDSSLDTILRHLSHKSDHFRIEKWV